MSAAAGASPNVSAPLVSVIIPAFNAEATLRKTAASALAGSFRNLELIVVNDGSTDGTAAIAEDLSRTHPRVRLHRQPNRGLSAALNSGFALARGDYVARLDADDLWHPTKLEKQVELAQREPELAFIYCWVRYIDERDRVVREAPPQRFPRRALCRGLYESLVGGGSSALMKRSAVAEAGGCEESFRSWEDLLLQLKISALHPIGHVPEYLVGYRVGAGSLTTDAPKMLRTWRQVRDRVKLLFPQVPRRVQNWAHTRRCAMFAESFAWRGEAGRCAGLMLEAMRHDPAWTSRFLAYRAARHLRRRFSGGAEEGSGPAFFECRPDERLRPSAYDSGAEGQLLRRLESRRERRLAALDEALAGGGD